MRDMTKRKMKTDRIGGADKKLDFEREHEMYSKEQREKALALYDKCHSVTKVMQSLGFQRVGQVCIYG